MKRPIRIRFSGINSSSELIVTAQSHALRLAWDDSEIIACWVGIRRDPEQPSPGPRYSVRVDVVVPGHELIAKTLQHETASLALGQAFADMERQLAGIDPSIHHAQYAVTIPGMLLTPEDLAGEKRYGDRRGNERRNPGRPISPASA